jgi:hypothetical protein
MLRTTALLFVVALVGCDSPQAVPDTGIDAGSDAGASDSGAPDAGAACLGGSTCDLVPNRGCGAAQTCSYAYAGGARTNACLAPGARALGEVCAASTDCARGLNCLNGFCLELCCPGAAPDSCMTGTTCGAVTLTISAGVTDDVGLCGCTIGGAACPAGHYCDPTSDTRGICLAQGSCDRLMQDCPSGQGCYGTIRECATAGTVAEDGACTAHRDCMPGLWCRNVSADVSQCTRYCEVGGPDVCPAGTMCMSFGDDEPQVGGCYPPP